MSLCLTSHIRFICNLISSVLKGLPKYVCCSPARCHHLSQGYHSLSRFPLQWSFLPTAQEGKSRWVRAGHTQSVSASTNFPTTLRVTSHKLPVMPPSSLVLLPTWPLFASNTPDPSCPLSMTNVFQSLGSSFWWLSMAGKSWLLSSGHFLKKNPSWSHFCSFAAPIHPMPGFLFLKALSMVCN